MTPLKIEWWFSGAVFWRETASTSLKIVLPWGDEAGPQFPGVYLDAGNILRVGIRWHPRPILKNLEIGATLPAFRPK
jgi:hypothetical protein